MRLKQIKLAGFKSFVDPTTVSFPGNRNAVVGPNGCGKSNIVDAVRWVMGERSARQLRGDSMTDVIFNGGEERQPTAMASVELLFDNQDSRVGGEYASYGEIAVRRELGRDGQSVYYLNGSRCRRRDIGGVFLGTGFGPRSYSIIEQGMISELADAKPDELRAFLEEAAGISKYRERRRETRNRLSRTRDHMDRIGDVRAELARQLSRLERQARGAERHRRLKEEERRRTAELEVLRLAAIDASLGASDEALAALSRELETAQATRHGIGAREQLEQQRYQERTDALNAANARYHRLGAEVARLEDAVRADGQSASRLEADRAGIDAEDARRRRQLEEDSRKIEELGQRIEAARPVLADCARADEAAAAAVTSLEREAAATQVSWLEFGERAMANRSAMTEAEGRVDLAEATLERLRSAAADLDREIEGLDVPRESAEQGAELAAARSALDAADTALRGNADAMAAARAADAQRTAAADAAADRLQSLRGRAAALEALQRDALAGPADEEADVEPWLATRGLDARPRLGADLSVTPGWEAAVDAVIGHDASAVTVDDAAGAAAELETLSRGRLTLTERAADPRPGALPRLASHIVPRAQAPALLDGIFAAQTVEEALGHRTALGPGESIVTRDGVWLGKGWIRINRTASDAAAGNVIRRGAELAALAAELARAEASALSRRGDLDEARATLASLDRERERLQAQRSEAAEKHTRAEAAKDIRLAQRRDAAERAARLDAERGRTAAKIRDEDATLARQRAKAEELARAAQALAAERTAVDADRDGAMERLARARADAGEARERHHRARGEVQRLESTLEAARTGRERLESQGQDHARRRRQVDADIAAIAARTPALKADLDGNLGKRLAAERELAAARADAEQAQENLRALRGDEAEADAAIESVRERTEGARLERERVLARHRATLERFEESGLSRDAVAAELPDDAEPSAWEGLIEEVGRRIERLGAVNLAAAQERAECAERKDYIDSQFDDLKRATVTLEKAIESIDRETRTRFKETFDRVNDRFSALFPRIFGGGEARLELTERNLLETGVTLMARPPGKRNASIHLLSGGEKAMTAVALLFAIFQLNPSPVCLLDEVDAPLDDANVARFKDLIEEMSSGVQFVVVTHNKLTMEMADHLMGVTMQEPGVSRMVSVDVDQASELAQAPATA